MAGAVIKNHLKRTILHLSEFSIQVKVVLVIQFVRLTAQVVKEKGTLTGLNRRVILGGERVSIQAMLKVVMVIIEKTTNVLQERLNVIQKKSIFMMLRLIG